MTAPEDIIGQTWAGRYVIRSMLGQGGMATVYAAQDKTLKRDVAIKILRPDAVDGLTAARRLQREARAAGRLHHKHIITFHDVGVAEERVFIVMEHLSGRTLKDELIATRRMGHARACAIGAQISAALRVVHGAGIVHRDLKPENVFLVDGHATGDFCKLLDFSIAKLPEAMVDGQLTVTGTIFGTPHYMSCEQAMGDPVSAASDIYSLGTILFELVAGRTPFVAKNPVDLVTQQCLAPAPRITEFTPGVPRRLDELLAAMLAKEPAGRPATAMDVEEALTAIGALPSEPRAGGRLRPRKRLPDADRTQVGPDSSVGKAVTSPSAVFRDISGRPPASRAAKAAPRAESPKKVAVESPSAAAGPPPGQSTVPQPRQRSRTDTTRRPASQQLTTVGSVGAGHVPADRDRGVRATEPRAVTGRVRRLTVPTTTRARDRLQGDEARDDGSKNDDQTPVGSEDETI